MSTPVIHIIHRLNLDIQVQDDEMARRMYRDAGNILQQYVLPRLEELLKQYEDLGVHIRLDKLDINLEAVSTAAIEEMIKTQLAGVIVKELEQKLGEEQAAGPAHERRVYTGTHEERIIEAFMWFMQWGRLPWWIADSNEIAVSKNIIEAISMVEEKFIGLFVPAIRNNPVVLQRLLLQYDASLLKYLFSLVMPLELFSMAVTYERQAMDIPGEAKPGARFAYRYWQAVWTLLPVPELLNIDREVLKNRLELWITSSEAQQDDRGQASWPSILSGYPDDEEAGPAARQQEVHTIEAVSDKGDDTPVLTPGEIEEGMLGHHAGLILLHPFLQYFFMEFRLLDGDQFKNESCRGLAVHLLHYLATGKEHAPDFDLVFEKYLCGMDHQQVTPRYTNLTEKMKTEAGELLQSVIKHWSVLKNTSAEALQESFLQRRGKLITKDAMHHRLIMEQHTLDILLQQIPWNIALIKLPWMKSLLHVEWNT